MPFVGTVHAGGRRVLAQTIPFLPDVCHVLCSGNFSIEATLRLNGYNGTLTSSDISLYTSALGAYFAGDEMDLMLRLDLYPELEPLAAYLGDMESKAALVALALDIIKVYPRKNLFQGRLYAHYMSTLDAKIEKTKEKLRKRKDTLRLDEYKAEDAWARSVRFPGDAILTFPPTVSGDYARFYADLETLFEWPAPTFEPLTTGDAFAERVATHDGPWIFGTEKGGPELEAHLGPPFALAQTDTAISLYSNIPQLAEMPRLIRRHLVSEDPHWPRLTSHDTIGPKSKLTVHVARLTHLNYLRQLYTGVDAVQGPGDWGFAVAIDGKCAGLLIFKASKFGMKIEGEVRDDTVYMLSDTPVTNEKYPRLSKLMLFAAMSKEVQHVLEAKSLEPVNWIVTTAFSKRPMSMKYRGVFKLVSRKERADGTNVLNYAGPAGSVTLKQGFREWYRRFEEGK